MHLHVIAIVAGCFSAAIWIYLLFGRGRFWMISPTPAAGGKQRNSSVAVIVPARDEASFIGQSISSLLQQNYTGSVHVFLVDDSSRDGTSNIARESAQAIGRSAGLTIISGQPLPPGWSGKLWALHQGVEAARPLDPEFFLLTDADVVHSPDTISTLASVAETGGYDLASFMVRLHCRRDAEKLLIPAFVFFFFMLYPPAWIANPRRKTAGAAGGCILIRPQALAKAGGVESIRDEIIDDCALARAVKLGGGRVWLGTTASSVSVRPYRSAFDIGRMISRTAFNQLHHSSLLLLMTIIGLTLTYLVPLSLLLSEHAGLVAFGALLWFAMSVSFLRTVVLYRLNPLWALTLPVTAVFYLGATVHSAVRYWLGRGGEWKGRVQDPARSRVAG
ncbi:MAG TPA: glycosyltransferase [Terriglobales bacterium]|nr:glycosyltransferase [Terriglobales bacterium]